MTVIDLTQNYFDLFSLPHRYTLDVDALEARYRELQRAVHPDKFVNASDREKRISMQQTTFINEAYQSLKDPVERGQYMLLLEGCPIETENRTTKDMEFLVEQMELRETLEEVRSQADPLQALDELSARVDSNISLLEADLNQMLNQGAQEPAVETVLKMQFYAKLKAEVSELGTVLEDALYD